MVLDEDDRIVVEVSDSGFSVFREAGPDGVEEAETLQGVVRAVQIVIWRN